MQNCGKLVLLGKTGEIPEANGWNTLTCMIQTHFTARNRSGRTILNLRRSHYLNSTKDVTEPVTSSADFGQIATDVEKNVCQLCDRSITKLDHIAVFCVF